MQHAREVSFEQSVTRAPAWKKWRQNGCGVMTRFPVGRKDLTSFFHFCGGGVVVCLFNNYSDKGSRVSEAWLKYTFLQLRHCCIKACIHDIGSLRSFSQTFFFLCSTFCKITNNVMQCNIFSKVVNPNIPPNIQP